MLGNPPSYLGTLQLAEVDAAGAVAEGFLAAAASRAGNGGRESGHALSEEINVNNNNNNNQTTHSSEVGGEHRRIMTLEFR